MRCASHMEIDAAGVCIKCGRGVCVECKREMGGKTYCQVCADVYGQLQPEAVSSSGQYSAGTPQSPQSSPITFVASSEFAGFGRRLLSWLIDIILLSIVFVPLGLSVSETVYYSIAAPIQLMYYIGLWTWKGQTIGKMAMGIKIVAADGGPIGLGRAILRYLGYIVSGVLLGLGHLMIAFDGRKQGLHDKIAGTFVVKI